jgi:hypothetical protein
MLARRGSGKWHGKWKENGEKSKRFRDAENVSRIALCEEFTTFVTSENVVKSMPKRRGKVIGNGRKSTILVPGVDLWHFGRILGGVKNDSKKMTKPGPHE